MTDRLTNERIELLSDEVIVLPVSSSLSLMASRYLGFRFVAASRFHSALERLG